MEARHQPIPSLRAHIGSCWLLTGINLAQIAPGSSQPPALFSAHTKPCRALAWPALGRPWRSAAMVSTQPPAQPRCLVRQPTDKLIAPCPFPLAGRTAPRRATRTIVMAQQQVGWRLWPGKVPLPLAAAGSAHLETTHLRPPRSAGSPPGGQLVSAQPVCGVRAAVAGWASHRRDVRAASRTAPAALRTWQAAAVSQCCSRAGSLLLAKPHEE